MEVIERVEILENGQLILVLASGGNASYQHIYREAVEVKWNNNLKAFTSPLPREWSYSDWFHHIIKVARNCNIHLETNNQTIWVNIPTDAKNGCFQVTLPNKSFKKDSSWLARVPSSLSVPSLNSLLNEALCIVSRKVQ